MNLLLDTHIFLWSLRDPARLSQQVAEALELPSNTLWLSPITTWEVMILAEKGRIVLDAEPGVWMRRVFERIPFREAPLNHEVAILSRQVRLPHQDPADRFLAATAKVHELTLVTADRQLLALEELDSMGN